VGEDCGEMIRKEVAEILRFEDIDSGFRSILGRAAVWDEISYYVQRRPILGYGFGGFWTPSHIREISEEEKWGIPNGHSAYLDYLLTLGAVGLVGYVLLLFAGIRRAFQFYRLSGNSAFAFFGSLLVFCALDGLLESAITEPSLAMFLCLVVLTYLAVMNDSRAQRFRHLSRDTAMQPS
jgi:O-antigen ligase